MMLGIYGLRLIQYRDLPQYHKNCFRESIMNRIETILFVFTHEQLVEMPLIDWESIAKLDECVKFKKELFDKLDDRINLYGEIDAYNLIDDAFRELHIEMDMYRIFKYGKIIDEFIEKCIEEECRRYKIER